MAANQKVQTSINQTNKPTKTIHTKQWKHKSSHFLSSLYFPRKNKHSRIYRTSQSFTDRQETTMASHGNKSEEEAAISEAPNTPISTIVIIVGTQYYTLSLIYMWVCWCVYFYFLLSGFWLFFAYVVLFMVILWGASYADRGASFGEQVPAYWGPWLRVSFLFSVFLIILFLNFDDKVTSLGLRSQKSWSLCCYWNPHVGKKRVFF